MTSTPTTSTWRDMPGLTGLRGIAVALVVAYHLGHLGGGFIGVDVFFVLSGFLITSLLLHTPPATPAQMARWWGKRIRRLTPAVAVTVLVVVVFFATTAGIAMDGLATLTWWQNWHLVFEGSPYWSDAASPLRHAWSLSIEEQFYLLWPPLVAVVVLLTRRWSRGHTATAVAVLAVLGAGASFVWAAHLSTVAGVGLTRIYYGTDTRAGALLLGCGLAAVTAGRVHRAGPVLSGVAALGATVLGALTIVISPEATWSYRGGLALAAVAASAVVLGASRPGPITTLLSWAPLRWLGVRSYAVYLWSWPTQVLLEQRAPGLPSVAVAIIVAVVSVGLADVSLRFVEAPLRHADSWATAVRPRRAAWVVGGAAVTLALVLAAASTRPTVVEQLAEEAVRLPDPVPAAPVDGPTTTTCVPTQSAPVPEWSEDTTAYDPATVEPGADPSSDGCEQIRLLVVGDSTGRGTANALRRVDPPGIEVWDRTEIGCGLEPPGPECPDWREIWATAVAEIDPDVVLVYLGVSSDLVADEDPPFLSEAGTELRQAEVARAVDVLGAEGARVIWVLPAVPLESAAYFCRREFVDSPCDRDWVDRWHRDIAATAGAVPMSTIDVRAWVESRGSTAEDRPDGLHLSGPALVAHARWMVERLQAT